MPRWWPTKVCEQAHPKGYGYLLLSVRRGKLPSGQPALFRIQVKDTPLNRENNYHLLRHEFWTRICRQMALPVCDRHPVFQHEDVIEFMAIRSHRPHCQLGGWDHMLRAG